MANVLHGEYLRLFSYARDLFISGVDFRMLSDNCNYCIDGLNEWFTVNDT